jgi:hypothetical protein
MDTTPYAGKPSEASEPQTPLLSRPIEGAAVYPNVSGATVLGELQQGRQLLHQRAAYQRRTSARGKRLLLALRSFLGL